MRKIGRYEICGRLGRGGMGAVYKARLPELGTVVALKLLEPVDHLADLLGAEAVREMFLREARIMASLDHPNIAAIRDAGEHTPGPRPDGEPPVLDGPLPYFVMDYYCGNLGHTIGESYRVEEPSRRLPLDRAVSYAMQTLEGLRRMHHAGIVHRDVKPFNLMISGQDTVKLIDFGLSRLRGEMDTARPRTLKVGSPYYTAPEQERDPASADARSDIYGVGVILFRMLTGRLPEDEEGRSFRASDLSPDCDADWDYFFQRALAVDPEERFQDAQSMAAALETRFAAWRRRVDAVCGIDESAFLADPAELTAPAGWPSLRKRPVKARESEAAQKLGIDTLGRPLNRHVSLLVDQGDGTVSDEAAGLLWEREGSDYPLTWEEAAGYVESLNERRFAGHADWRLPTVPELSTLVEDTPSLGDFCLPPVFAPDRRQIWSADRRSFMAAWYLDAAMGFVGSQDFTCRFWARAVRNRG